MSQNNGEAYHGDRLRKLMDKEFREKRAKRLCYKYNAKWSVSHKCSKNSVFL